MRKLVVTEFLTLDNVMEEPGTWPTGYWNDEIANFKQGELFNSDALLLGRITYEGFAKAWPDRTDADGFADRMNSIPKYVVSTTLKKPEWNNTHVIKDNIVKEIKKLKQAPGKDLLLHGSATLLQTLIEHNLVDEYHLLVYPFIFGKGKRLFKDGTKTILKLKETRTYSTGVVLLIYGPDTKKTKK